MQELGFAPRFPPWKGGELTTTLLQLPRCWFALASEIVNVVRSLIIKAHAREFIDHTMIPCLYISHKYLVKYLDVEPRKQAYTEAVSSHSSPIDYYKETRSDVIYRGTYSLKDELT
mgnify:FL=1